MGRPSRRGEILEIGVDMLHRKGFTATSVDSITVAAGVPKGAFFNHFGSKEAFAVEALRRYFERWEDKIAPLADDATAPVIGRIRALIAAACRSDDATIGVGCMLGNLSGELGRDEGQITKTISGIFVNWERHFQILIDEGQKTGQLNASVPSSQAARLIVNGMQGALLRSKVDHNSVALKDLDTMIGLVLGVPPNN